MTRNDQFGNIDGFALVYINPYINPINNPDGNVVVSYSMNPRKDSENRSINDREIDYELTLTPLIEEAKKISLVPFKTDWSKNCGLGRQPECSGICL